MALLLVCGYFAPTIVAWSRGNHTSAIFALNPVHGWTLIGWVAALVMALWSNPAKERDTIGEPDWRGELVQIRHDARRLLHR